MDIVFNINHLGLEGLGSTLSSLVRNCSNTKELTLWFLISDFEKDDRSNINELLTSEGFKGKIEFVTFNAKERFGYLKSLHGDWTTYGRLLIPSIIESDRALYLDSDTVVLVDVLSLREFDFGNYYLAACRYSNHSQSSETTFFIDQLGFSPDAAYFNAGVLYFNLKLWRELKIDEILTAFSVKYPNPKLADQTLFNGICKGEFAVLPPNYNNPWYPNENEPKMPAEDSIIHFVGSPKPWDLFARFIHRGVHQWSSYNSKFWKAKYGKISVAKLQRTWEIKNSILLNFAKRSGLLKK